MEILIDKNMVGISNIDAIRQYKFLPGFYVIVQYNTSPLLAPRICYFTIMQANKICGYALVFISSLITYNEKF